MTSEQLRELQTPLKNRYRDDPATAHATLTARGELDLDRVVCRIDTGRSSEVDAGLHPMAGGDSSLACAGNILLEALCGCAGVTLCAVATAFGLDVASGSVTVSGDMDFRGTLGVDKSVPVGFTAIRVECDLETSADDAQLEKLGSLTERYCVVAQSLAPRPTVKVRRRTAGGS